MTRRRRNVARGFVLATRCRRLPQPTALEYLPDHFGLISRLLPGNQVDGRDAGKGDDQRQPIGWHAQSTAMGVVEVRENVAFEAFKT